MGCSKAHMCIVHVRCIWRCTRIISALRCHCPQLPLLIANSSFLLPCTVSVDSSAAMNPQVCNQRGPVVIFFDAYGSIFSWLFPFFRAIILLLCHHFFSQVTRRSEVQLRAELDAFLRARPEVSGASEVKEQVQQQVSHACPYIYSPMHARVQTCFHCGSYTLFV